MCDTLVRVEPNRVLFAKNSDRDGNEAQVLDWQPARRWPAGERLRCTWMAIPQARETFAVLLSRPYWMWGAEIGANEHGVVIGNEAMLTRGSVPRTGLTGMDLLRLGLERAATAEQAVEVIVSFAERHGQGGGCGHEHRSFRYFSSFAVADPTQAFVLETCGERTHAVAVEGNATISNRAMHAPWADAVTDPVRTYFARAARRQVRSSCLLGETQGVGDLFAALRDHGAGVAEPVYDALTGGLATVCMHAGGMLAASQTTASWVSELSPGSVRHWATATAAPCTALFKPVAVESPLALGHPTDRYDGASLWWRHEQLHRLVMRDPVHLLGCYRTERDALEAQWLSAPPSSADAFAEGDRRLAEWTRRVEEAAAGGRDRRPWSVRRYLRLRNRRAGISPGR